MYQIYTYIYECMKKQAEVHRKKGQRSGEVCHRVSAAIAGPMHENKNTMHRTKAGQSPMPHFSVVRKTRFGINFSPASIVLCIGINPTIW